MIKLSKQQVQHGAWIAGGIVAGLILLALWAYKTSFSDPLTSTLKRTFPAKVVGSHVVSIYDLETAQKIASRMDNSSNPSQISKRLVEIEKIRNLSKELGIGLNSDDVSDELTYLKKGNEAEYDKLLKEYFNGSEAWFTKFVAYPSAWEALIRIKYNSNSAPSSDSYRKANELMARMKQGEKFEDLAKAHSEDRVTGQLGGDLGCYEHGQIIPELADEISISALGLPADKIVISRHGYHLIYPVETSLQNGTKLWHAKHILIKNPGFEQWLEQNTAEIGVWNIRGN